MLRSNFKIRRIRLNKLAVVTVLALASGLWLAAQTADTQRREPSYDELVAYLKLSDAQLACLKSNQQAFRTAVSADMEKLRDLGKQLRDAVRAGADTAAIRSEMDKVRSSIQATRNSHVATAQACVGGAAALKELIAAESLMREVHQAIGLLLIQPTESHPFGAGLPGPALGRRGH